MARAGLAGLVLLAGLSACATTPPPAATVAAPVLDSGQIDGRYRGIARLTRANVAGCPRSGNRIVTVTDSAMSLPYRGPRASYSLVANVAPDGSISGSDGRGSIQGKLSGRHMDLIVSSDYCEVRYAVDRQ